MNAGLIHRLPVLIILISLTYIPSLFADEGMWPLYGDKQADSHIDNFHEDLCRSMTGPSNPDIADLKKIRALGRATVRINNGTAVIVSGKGLLLTNYHVISEFLKHMDDDLIRNGFIASSAIEQNENNSRNTCPEHQCKEISVRLLIKEFNVTHEIIGCTNNDPRAIRKRMEEVKAKHADSITSMINTTESVHIECDVVSLFNGAEYHFVAYERFDDVRLVYVPPRRLAYFDFDNLNFRWPRFSADFAFLRIYRDNKPFNPFSAGIEPVLPAPRERCLKSGDTVFVLGYPGFTGRDRSHLSLHYRQKYWLPIHGVHVPEMLSMEFSKNKDLADTYFDSIHQWKNVIRRSKGNLKSFDESDAIRIKYEKWKILRKWLEDESGMLSDGTRQVNIEAMDRIETLYRFVDQYAPLQIFFSEFIENSKLMQLTGILLKYRSVNRATDTLNKSRDEIHACLKDKDKLIAQKTRLISLFKAFKETSLMTDVDSEKPLYPQLRNNETRIDINDNESMVIKNPFFALRNDIDSLINPSESTTIEPIVDILVKRYQLLEPNRFHEIVSLSEVEFDRLRRKDVLLNFAVGLHEQQSVIHEHSDLWGAFLGGNAEILSLRKSIDHVKRISRIDHNLYPNANGTLRFSHGKVLGPTTPENPMGTPITYIDDLLKWPTGSSGFVLSKDDRCLMAKEKHLRIPVNILNTCDTTGGNSGSPGFNIQGELIGLYFDGPEESLGNDYLYNRNASSGILTDLRYILFILRQYGNASALIDEFEQNQ